MLTLALSTKMNPDLRGCGVQQLNLAVENIIAGQLERRHQRLFPCFQRADIGPRRCIESQAERNHTPQRKHRRATNGSSLLPRSDQDRTPPLC